MAPPTGDVTGFHISGGENHITYHNATIYNQGAPISKTSTPSTASSDRSGILRRLADTVQRCWEWLRDKVTTLFRSRRTKITAVVALIVAVAVAVTFIAIWVISVLRTCDRPKTIQFGDAKCSNVRHKVGTSCNISCSQNHLLFAEGKYFNKDDYYKIECLEKQTWSEEDLPSCVCPHCYTGDQCQWTTSWKVMKNNIIMDVGLIGGKSKFNYAGHEISTNAYTGLDVYKLEWICVCKDTKMDALVKCTKKSPSGSCVHACSKLILDLVDKGKYEEAPCDRPSMKTDC